VQAVLVAVVLAAQATHRPERLEQSTRAVVLAAACRTQV